METGNFAGAREQYRLALEAQGPPRVRGKLEALGTAAASVSSARFWIRYDGAADEPLGLSILRVLDTAWEEYERRLGFAPDFPVTVVLQTATAFRDTTRAPDWQPPGTTARSGSRDGPRPPHSRLVRVLRHELAHSFVAARAGAQCPTWLHEGLAQWLEGGDPDREDPALARRARLSRLPRLESLERPSWPLRGRRGGGLRPEPLGRRAPAEAAWRGRCAPAHRGPPRGQPAAEALPTAFALSYGELQRDWEAHLARSGGPTRPAS